MSRLGRSQPVQPIVSHGFLGNVPANGTLPGRITVVENDDRRRRTPPLQPLIINGRYATVAPPFVPPPRAQFSIQPERARPLPLPVFGAHGFLGNTPANGVLPQRPTISEVDERRRRVLAAFPEIKHGYDDPAPPAPELIEPERRRPLPPPPISISGVLGFVVAVIAPPRATVIEHDLRRWRYPTLEPIAFSAALHVVPVTSTVVPQRTVVGVGL